MPRAARALEAWILGGGILLVAGERPFWEETPGARPVVPRGVPGGFADLAERVSQAVVNIQTSKTVTQGPIPGLPPHFEEFFGGRVNVRRRKWRLENGLQFGQGPHARPFSLRKPIESLMFS